MAELYAPRWQSQPWYYEAVGTAEWTVYCLSTCWSKQSYKLALKMWRFSVTDRGFDAGIEHNYGRSLRPADAQHDDILVAWAMNGKPLLPQHGFPLRRRPRLVWHGQRQVARSNRGFGSPV